MPLSKEDSLSVFSKINNGFRLKHADSAELSEVFLAYSGWMAHQLRCSIDRVLSSNHFIKDKHFEDLKSLTFEHAIIGKLRSTDNGFNPVVEHDAESWLNDAAELQTEIFLRKMEGYIKATGSASYKEKMEFLKKIDFDTCEAIVRADFADTMHYLDHAVDQKFLLIRSDQEEGFWSNGFGWVVDKESATRFTQDESAEPGLKQFAENHGGAWVCASDAVDFEPENELAMS